MLVCKSFIFSIESLVGRVHLVGSAVLKVFRKGETQNGR